MLVAASVGHIKPKCPYFAFLFSVTFILGLFAGVYIASQNASTYVSLIRRATAASQIPIGSLIRNTYIFVFSAIVYKRRGFCFLLLSFIEAFTFGVASAAIWSSFGSAQWLLHSLLLFSRIVTLVMLHWFWLRNIGKQGSAGWRDFLIAWIVSILAVVIERFVLSPYLCDLFELSRKVSSYVGFGTSL